MKSLIGLLLTLSIALPACSADNGSTEPAANTGQANANVADPAPAANTATVAPPVMAQVRDPGATPAVTTPAVRSDIVAGKHYRVLTPTQPTSSSPDQIEVAEVFMYSCPHCMDFEPFIKTYLAEKPAYVSFVQIPASFNKMARLHSKAFYMAATLGILDDIHADFFTEFHKKNNRLADENAIIEFFTDHGVAREDVINAYNSFAVDTKLRQADDLARRYGISSVPTLVINGKYVTSGSMTGSLSKLRDVVDYLTAKEAAER